MSLFFTEVIVNAKKGFAILEILLVIGIISTIAGIASVSTNNPDGQEAALLSRSTYYYTTPTTVKTTASSTPAGTTCTSFVYSNWMPLTCTPGVQMLNRMITSKSPAGCVGGNPILTFSCPNTTPTTPTCTYTCSSSNWGTCTNGVQYCTNPIPSPAGCIGGNPSLSKSCNQTTPTPFYVSCWPNPAEVLVGGTVRWYSNIQNGTGSFTYSWMGTDSLTGTTASVSKRYDTASIKNARVTVTSTSGLGTASYNCTAVVKPTTTYLDGSCSPNKSSVNSGEIVTWTATPIGGGGPGSYTYVWRGDVTGTSMVTSRAYSVSTTTTMSAEVTITSGGTSVIKRCSVVVNLLPTCIYTCLNWGPCSTYDYNGTQYSTQNCLSSSVAPAGCTGGNPVIQRSCSYPLDGSCTANTSATTTNKTVTWTATASGAPGPYTFSWIGDDLPATSGNPITRIYTTPGTKRTDLLISYNGQSITRSCSVRIFAPLDGSCVADPLNVNLGERTAWTAFPTGGEGPYSYVWSGDDGLTGTGSSTSIIYPTANPRKNAMVTIRSGSEMITRGCQASVTSASPGEVLSGSCLANPHYADIGSVINWVARGIGGPTSQYTFTWKLDGELFNTSSAGSITKSYNTVGIKEAAVKIVSGAEEVDSFCSAEVGLPFTPINISCSSTQTEVDVGQPMIWGATVSGGNGIYSYTWSGSDSLQNYKIPSTDSFSTTTKTYYTTGTKLGRVTVTSKGQSASKDCYVTVKADTSTVRITNFTFTNAEVTSSVINQDTGVITIDVPSNTNTAYLIPAITLSPDTYTTLIDVQAERGNDFTRQRDYKVKYTTDDYSTPKTYYVFVNKAFRQDGRDIISCSLPGITSSACIISQSARTVSITVPAGTDKTKLAPTFVLSPKATIQAASGSVQNFSKPRAYLVTSELGNTKRYIVEVNTPPKITTFKVRSLSPRGNYTGVIDEKASTITLTLPPNTDLTKLTTSIRTSTEGADYVRIDPGDYNFHTFYTAVSYYYNDSRTGGIRTSQRGVERSYNVIINYLPTTS